MGVAAGIGQQADIDEAKFRSVVQGFLEAETVEERAKYVRNPGRVTPLMIPGSEDEDRVYGYVGRESELEKEWAREIGPALRDGNELSLTLSLKYPNDPKSDNQLVVHDLAREGWVNRESKDAKPIFNGKDLTGWKVPADNIWWSVVVEAARG